MKLHELMDKSKLEQYIAEGFISVRNHPTLPIRIYNYTASAQFENFWPHEVCQCRGLIVDADDNIVSRAQYKFFNLGQTSTILNGFPVEGVMVDADFLLDMAERHHSSLTITRKMDGMMGVLWNYGDQWGIATRGSFESEGAVFATEKWQKFVKYGATEFVPKGYTLIFEIIAKHLRIVVPYAWEGLCLLTAVNVETGEEMPYWQLEQVWQNLNSYSKTIDANGNSVPGKPWCRLVENFNISLEEAKADPSMEEEGYVVAVNRGGLPPVKAKIKLAEYLRLHKLLCGVTPQMIWAELANPMEPWLATQSKFDHATKETTHSMQVPAEFAQWVLQWQRGLTKAFHEKLLQALEAVSGLRGADIILPPFKNDSERKAYLAENYGKEVAGFAMQLYNGRIVEAYADIWKSVRPFGKDDRFYVEGKGE